MTQFNNKSENSKSGETAASGKDFLEQCREHLEDAVADCAADYDGQSVEEFAQDIVEHVWKVEDADLKRSFKNGRDYRRGRSGRRSR